MASERGAPSLGRLRDELQSAHAEFTAALASVEPALLTAPGLVGEWSGRELLGHLALWSEHAVEALEHAAAGRLHEFGDEAMDVDAINAVQAARDAEAEISVVVAREQAAYERLTAAMDRAEPAWLEERAAYGDTLAEILRDDGSDHYREHAADIRAWFGSGDDDEEDA